ncbi:MAG: flavodoxin family protein [Methanomicrobiales archaeon]|nr:flavodoxin family protein [Methanomicrobiales archaeon]
MIRSETIIADGQEFRLVLHREDLARIYTGMVRFTLRILRQEKMVASFCTNSHEYSPMSSLEAEGVALRTMKDWAEDLRRDYRTFLERFTKKPSPAPADSTTDILILQGSPRPDGNCSMLAGWAADAATRHGKRFQVVFLGDLQIHPCIGCYQCYSTGTCAYADDMEMLIPLLRSARLVVVCSPVYTNTVPGGLKIFIDRSQALHAQRSLGSDESPPSRGILLAVAGRRGAENFTCVTKVVGAFFRHLGIQPARSVLIDDLDTVRDVRTVPGIALRVGDAVDRSLAENPGERKA